MMAIFPRKYQRPRISGMSGCPPLLPPALLLLQACCRGYAAGAMPQGLCRKGYAVGATPQELCCRSHG